MQFLFDRLWQTHRFLTRQSWYAVTLSSLLAIGMLAGRVYLSHRADYIFLVWNLILAWVPYVLAVWMAYIYQRAPHRWWALLPVGLIWLVFFPNAPYIITDFFHLQYPRPIIGVWYDVVLLATFAWTGCFLGLLSLHTVQTLVKHYLGAVVSWLFVFGVLGMSGVGIYLGRFLRWNSWDLFFNPRVVLLDTASRVLNPADNLQFYGVVLMFSAFMLVAYLTFTSQRNRFA